MSILFDIQKMESSSECSVLLPSGESLEHENSFQIGEDVTISTESTSSPQIETESFEIGDSACRSDQLCDYCLTFSNLLECYFYSVLESVISQQTVRISLL